MHSWIDISAVLKILVLGLLLGGLLPALFAVGVRLNAVGVGDAGGDAAAAQRHPALIAIAWAIFALVLALVIVGVLFIARDFIGHQFGLYILGAKHGK
jgi:hypothetical protein